MYRMCRNNVQKWRNPESVDSLRVSSVFTYDPLGKGVTNAETTISPLDCPFKV
jgi:hypothetical protein